MPTVEGALYTRLSTENESDWCTECNCCTAAAAAAVVAPVAVVACCSCCCRYRTFHVALPTPRERFDRTPIQVYYNSDTPEQQQQPQRHLLYCGTRYVSWSHTRHTQYPYSYCRRFSSACSAPEVRPHLLLTHVPGIYPRHSQITATTRLVFILFL